MKQLIIALFFIYSAKLTAQNQTYYVKQTQMSKDAENWQKMDINNLFTKIVFKENGIEFTMFEGKFTVINYNRVNKVDLENNSYRYEISISEGLDVVLFFAPYPLMTNPPKMLMGIISMSGVVKSAPERISFFRLAFIEDLVIQ
ncbi:hypothetical protein ACRASX_16300 (plasmid) [Flavobacterium sp. TMP13]|uniref:hypothetical protein n=1 Tax=Flavobacterium sp. TMP13 TaxID=3425950 RepID=UPI003D78729D